MSTTTATEMCTARSPDHNINNCIHSGNVCCCTYMVNNDYDKFTSFSWGVEAKGGRRGGGGGAKEGGAKGGGRSVGTKP